MIASLRGKLIETTGSTAIIDVSGVGYELICTRDCLEQLISNQEVFIHVYTEVREDRISLFGFKDLLEKHVFKLLTLVKGLGSKSATEIISKIEKTELLKIIAEGNVTKLQTIKGIGKKTSERIIVELKDKVAEYASNNVAVKVSSVELEAGNEAINALISLGFNKSISEKAVSLVGQNFTDSSSIIREALKNL